MLKPISFPIYSKLQEFNRGKTKWWAIIAEIRTSIPKLQLFYHWLVSFLSSFSHKIERFVGSFDAKWFCYRYNFAYYFTFIKYLALQDNHSIMCTMWSCWYYTDIITIDREIYTAFYAKISFISNPKCFPYILIFLINFFI